MLFLCGHKVRRLFVLYRPDQDVWAFGVEPAKVRYRLRLARYPAFAEYLSDWLLDKPKDQTYKLLDIGAGFGRTFLYMKAAGIAERFELHGIDIDPLRKDDVYAGNPWQITQADAQAPLPYADNSLDVMVCEQLLEHLRHPQKVLDSAQRMLKPGGLFIVGVPIFPEPIAKLRRWWVGRFGLRGSDHIQTYSLRSIRRDLQDQFVELEARGFRIISGGILRGLENHLWWYRLNRWVGRLLPGLCIEVQLIVQKPADE